MSCYLFLSDKVHSVTITAGGKGSWEEEERGWGAGGTGSREAGRVQTAMGRNRPSLRALYQHLQYLILLHL